MKTSTKTLLALSLAAAFGGFAATAIREGLRTPAQAAPLPAATTPMTAALPAAVGSQTLPSLAPMLARVTPAVVSVHTKQRVRVSPFGSDPIFRRMFPELTQERINESLGSGVIVDAQRGLVLTNHHVIEGADAVSVTLSDGRKQFAVLDGPFSGLIVTAPDVAWDADESATARQAGGCNLTTSPDTRLRIAASASFPLPGLNDSMRSHGCRFTYRPSSSPR